MTRDSEANGFGSVTLNNCEREPIHIPGFIQPHGALIAFESGSGSVLHSSNNLSKFFVVKLVATTGYALKDLIGEVAYQSVTESLSFRAGTGVRHQMVGLPARPENGQPDELEALVHSHRGVCFIEFFKATAPSLQRDWLQEFDDTIDAMRSSQDLEELLDRAAHRVKRLTGFDRVMIYRFDAQWNGQVISEALESHLEPFHGLHYPASDIPPQARELYHKNLVRYIADVNYQPVQVTPFRNAVTQQPLDQSFVALRSISPMHIEYLQNMGVNSTLVMSILVNEKLWGLIACHHYTSTQLPVRLQRACHSLSITMGYMVMAKERQDRLAQQGDHSEGQLRIMNAFNQVEVKFEDVIEYSAAALLKMGQATAGVFWTVNALYPFGRWRSGPLGDALIAHARQQTRSLKDDMFFTDQLEMEPMLSPADRRQAAGMAVLRLDTFNEFGILWIRPEYRQAVHWGGNPDKAVTRTKDEKGQEYLTPRASFERWEMIVSGRSVPWSDMDQSALRSLSSLSEVLKVREALERVSLSDRRFRSLLSLQSDAYWQIDANGQLNVLSKTMTLSEEIKDSVSFLDVARKHGDADSFEGLQQALLQNKAFRNLPLVWTHNDKSQSEFIMHGEPMRNNLGLASGWHGTITDCTQNRRLEHELVASQAALAHSGRIASVGAWRFEIRTGNFQISDEIARIFELPVGEKVSLARFLELFSLSDRGIVRSLISDTQNSNTNRDLQVQFTNAGHQVRWVRLFGEVELVRGKPFAIRGACQDISDQKGDIARLEQARFQAEQANEAKSQFLANMSHEIRTPMNAVIGMLSLLETTTLSAQQADYVDKCEGAAKSLLGIINDILDFSKIEAGKLAIDNHPFNLDRLMRELSVLLSANADQKGIELIFNFGQNLPPVLEGDAMRLSQVLLNLSSNAVKFTEKGHVCISLERLPGLSKEPQVHIEFSVQDTGIGIDADSQTRIFSGFSQAEASTTRRFGGTGLGLVISKRLVEAMGGELQLASTPGQGSNFSFSLPFVIPATVSDADLAPGITIRPNRTLLIDDHPKSLACLDQMMQQLGWQVTQKPNMDEAVAELGRMPDGAAQPYEQVFIDCQLSPHDGWSTAAGIRQTTQRFVGSPPTIIMMFSNGRSLLSNRTQAEQDLINAFLVKPLTPMMMYHAITRSSGEAALRKGSRSQNSKRSLSGMRILVVEDNQINQQVAEELLTSQGALVSLAANGQLGVEAVLHQSPPFDVVLMDLQMPVMDGYEATKTIRQQLGLTELPIIAMTANAMESDRDACLAAGTNEHIGKPFDLSHLVSTLVRLTQWQDLGEDRSSSVAPAGASSPIEISVSGFDVNGALGRMGNSLPMYRKVLQSFIRDLPTHAEQLRHFFTQNQILEATRLIHTLKGLSATLGVQTLSTAALALEQKMKVAHRDGLPHESGQELLSLMEAEQERLLTLMDRLLEAEGAASRQAQATVMDADKVALTIQQLQKLVPLLEASDLTALEVFSGIDQHFPSPIDGQMEKLSEAMASMAFSEAVDYAGTLISSLLNDTGM